MQTSHPRSRFEFAPPSAMHMLIGQAAREGRRLRGSEKFGCCLLLVYAAWRCLMLPASALVRVVQLAYCAAKASAIDAGPYWTGRDWVVAVEIHIAVQRALRPASSNSVGYCAQSHVVEKGLRDQSRGESLPSTVSADGQNACQLVHSR